MIFMLLLRLWQHFLLLLHGRALLLGATQRVAGTRGDGIRHCPAWPQPCEPGCFIWGYERAQIQYCYKKAVSFEAVRANI